LPLGAAVASAEFSIFMAGGTTTSSKTVGLYQAARAWGTGATWTTTGLGTSWTTPGGDIAGARLATIVFPGGSPPSSDAHRDVTGVVRVWTLRPGENRGFLLKDEDTTNNVLRFKASESGIGPTLTIDYTVPEGVDDRYTYVHERSGRRLDLHVNVASGNLVVRQEQVLRPAPGIDFSFAYTFNSLGNARWTTDGPPGIGLELLGSSATYANGTGARFTFTRDAAGSWLRAPGIAADLVPRTDGGWEVRHDSGLTQVFDASGILTTALGGGRRIAYATSPWQTPNDPYTRLDAVTDAADATTTFTDDNYARIVGVREPGPLNHVLTWNAGGGPGRAHADRSAPGPARL